mmetsp:Transcript_10055/g.27521  ORF Transcript_10055/g.27521 Transcript_10055/m.27521 type:complete len:283 (-) Transcript_10055:169-1017(-)
MGSLKDVPLSNGEQRSRDQLHHFLYPQQRHQNQQHQENTSSRCLLTAAVQLIDGAHNNGAPPHLRSKWNRIRERLGRIQTAGAENKQRRSSQVLGAAPIPSSSLTSRSNSATASAAKATASHGPLSLPLPVPQGSVPSTSASINCIGSLNQQPSDPLVLCQASGRQSSSRKVYPDAPSPFPLYSRSNSSSSSSSTASGGSQEGPKIGEPMSWVERFGEGTFKHPYEYMLFLGQDARGDYIPCKQLRDRYNVQRRDVWAPGDDGTEDDEDDDGNDKPDIFPRI